MSSFNTYVCLPEGKWMEPGDRVTETNEEPNVERKHASHCVSFNVGLEILAVMNLWNDLGPKAWDYWPSLSRLMQQDLQQMNINKLIHCWVDLPNCSDRQWAKNVNRQSNTRIFEDEWHATGCLGQGRQCKTTSYILFQYIICILTRSLNSSDWNYLHPLSHPLGPNSTYWVWYVPVGCACAAAPSPTATSKASCRTRIRDVQLTGAEPPQSL